MQSSNAIHRTIAEAISHLRLFSKNGYVGLVWYLVDTFVLFCIFIYLRNVVILVDVPYYPLYLFIGISMFNFFRKVTVQPLNVVKKHDLGKKPNILDCLRLSPVVIVHGILLHSFEVLFLIIITSYYELSFLWVVFYIPFLFAISILYWIIASILIFLKTKWSNIKNAWMLLLRISFLVTPIFYSVRFLEIAEYNPLYQIITVGRKIIMYGEWFASLISLCVIIFFFCTVLFIKKVKWGKVQ
jgi:ABC-type polysaccharide/polyol phosphate export permease